MRKTTKITLISITVLFILVIASLLAINITTKISQQETLADEDLAGTATSLSPTEPQEVPSIDSRTGATSGPSGTQTPSSTPSSTPSDSTTQEITIKAPTIKTPVTSTMQIKNRPRHLVSTNIDFAPNDICNNEENVLYFRDGFLFSHVINDEVVEHGYYDAKYGKINFYYTRADFENKSYYKRAYAHLENDLLVLNYPEFPKREVYV
ncbi:hypothetical protein HOD75_01605 [archaeon]|jgi:hypothetical protein|nr:hypothetical protein [archaeon]MBT4241574.1 hypothetical protein [archaeon]MBT4417969.1 hypothetical protein [archaeon]